MRRKPRLGPHHLRKVDSNDRSLLRSRKPLFEMLEDRRLLAYTADLNAFNEVTFSGNAATDTLILSMDAAGNLQHNRFTAGDPGFASNIDLDSTAVGVQSRPATSVAKVFVTDAGGNDTLRVNLGSGAVDARVQAQNINGGFPADLLQSDNLPDIQFANLATFRLIGASNQTKATYVTQTLAGAAAYEFDSSTFDATVYIEGDAAVDDVFEIRNSPGPQNIDVFDQNANVTISLFSFLPGFDRVEFRTLGGDDSVTVNVDAAAGSDTILVPIAFDGGMGKDTLIVRGAPTTAINNVIYTPGLQIDEGRLEYLNAAGTGVMTIDWDNTEPIIELLQTAAAGGLIVNGTPGNNALNYVVGPNSGVVNALLNPLGASTGQVTVDNRVPIEFANKANLTINGLAGSDAINLNNPTTPTGLTDITVNGNDPTASDTLLVNGTPATETIVFSPTAVDSGTITVTGLPNIVFGTVEHVTINGQGGGDTLDVNTLSSDGTIVLTPGIALDAGKIEFQNSTQDFIAPNLSFLGLGAAGNITFTDLGQFDNLVYLGTNLADTFNVNAAGDVTLNNRIPVNTPSIIGLTLEGLSGDDTFNIAGNHNLANISIQGGSPSASDVLNFNGAGAAITADLRDRTITETGSGPVLFDGIEIVNIDAQTANLTARGTDVDDIFTYTPVGAASGTFVLEGLNTVFNFNDLATSVFTVDLRADVADEVIVRGTNNHDVITVDATARRVDVENVAGTVLAPVVLAASVETVTVRARLGNDTIVVVPAPAVAPGNLSIQVDGGAPSASDALVLAGALTRPNANSPVTNVTQFNAATDFVVQYRSLLPNEGRFRVFRNAVAMPDISYVDVETVSPIVDSNPNPNTGDPRLLILGPDEHEPNESRATAAFLGSGSVINVPHLAIFPDAAEHRFVPADQDFFRVVAQQTGTLDFQVYFRMFATNLLPAGGNINIEALDAAGNLIAGFGVADDDRDARVRIPVVAGQSYFLRVFGANANVVNGYDLTILNEGPPVPYDLELRDVIDASAIDAATSTTLFSGGAGLSAVDDFYNGKDLVFLTGANVGRRVRIVDYVGAARDFVVQPGVLVVTPTIGDLFQIESHDTGNSQLDNYTRDNTPLIFFRLDDAIFLQDLPGNPAPGTPPDEVIPIPFVTSQLAVPPAAAAGYRVAVFDNGDSDPQNPNSPPQNPVGFARMVSPGIYVFDFDVDALGGVPFPLSDGSHFLSARVQMIDPATPLQTGFGSRSVSLEMVVDSAAPPIFFGNAATNNDGLHLDSDSHVLGDVQPQNDFDDNQNINSRNDRVTSDTTPTFWGTAEANSTVRLYLDMNNNTTLELATDLFLGLAVAIPNGTNQFPFGQWSIQTNIDLNRSDIVTALGRYDGLRTIFTTAEDVAGNITSPLNAAQLNIFIDTQGPQITNLQVAGSPAHDLFDPKPLANGFTPLVNALTISIRDLPNRSNLDSNFLYQALVENIAENPGNYVLVGDHVGAISIQSIVWVPSPFPAANGQPALGTVTLNFFAPLPDDRYTLTVRDSLVDPAGNRLDGESNAVQPLAVPFFPSGDGVPGGNFVARFTIDSRPEIGSFVSQAINLDINGNFVWDPANAQIGNDATNVDLSFTLPAFENGSAIPGNLSPHELLVAGKFAVPTAGAALPTRLFDQLATYGNYNGVFRWLIDLDSDGVVYGNGDPDGVNDLIVNQGTLAGFNGTAVAGAIPIAGNFDGNAANGDEIGLYYAGMWAIDRFNHDFIIDTVLTGNLLGHPIVGDFDGNGTDDFGVFNNNVFSFGFNLSPTKATEIVWGFPGVLDRPVAADMDQDGIDDIGLWVPRNSANPPRIVAEWYFLVSNTFSAATRAANFGTVNRLNHGFSPVPFGADLYAEFGDELALPIVGNFDPPVAAAALGGGAEIAGDYDRNGIVDMNDKLVWRANFGSTTNLSADGNHDGRVDAADFVVWRNNLGKSAASGAALDQESVGQSAAASFVVDVVAVEHSTVSVAPEEVNRITAVDGLFAGLGEARSTARPAKRAALVTGLPIDHDNLLLTRLISRADRPAPNDAEREVNDKDHSADAVDELLAEFAGVDSLFE